MKPRTLLALPLAAALAGWCLPPAHAAAADSELRGVTQNWDKALPAEPGAGCPNWNTRFTCVMNNAAVRDNETGLVWTHPRQSQMSWSDANLECLKLVVGQRRGWRLPAVTEMASLIDMSNPSEIKLPANMPFIYQQKLGYYFWTSTPAKDPASTFRAIYYVSFRHGVVGHVSQDSSRGYVWCVRGGQPESNAY